jgi:hypothetical protein
MSLQDKIRAYRPEKPARLPISEAERELVNTKALVRQEWEASGLYMAKDENGNWRVTAADCKAEALRRLERGRAA